MALLGSNGSEVHCSNGSEVHGSSGSEALGTWF